MRIRVHWLKCKIRNGSITFRFGSPVSDHVPIPLALLQSEVRDALIHKLKVWKGITLRPITVFNQLLVCATEFVMITRNGQKPFGRLWIAVVIVSCFSSCFVNFQLICRRLS